MAASILAALAGCSATTVPPTPTSAAGTPSVSGTATVSPTPPEPPAPSPTQIPKIAFPQRTKSALTRATYDRRDGKENVIWDTAGAAGWTMTAACSSTDAKATMRYLVLDAEPGTDVDRTGRQKTAGEVDCNGETVEVSWDDIDTRLIQVDVQPGDGVIRGYAIINKH